VKRKTSNVSSSWLASLVFVIVALIVLWAFRAPLRRLAFQVSGEEELLAQARGLLQYASAQHVHRLFGR
jgi:hypothetical protein